MAYNEEKLTRLKALKQLAGRLKGETDALGGRLDALETRVDGLVTAGGEPNVITAVKNNGAALEITDKAVDIGASIAGAVAASDHLKRKKAESLEAIDPTAEGAEKFIYMVPKTGSGGDDLYDEYMVLDGAVEHVGSTRVDLSGKVDKVEGKGLSTEDFTTELKGKLEGIELATDEEVTAMLDEIFGTPAA